MAEEEGEFKVVDKRRGGDDAPTGSQPPDPTPQVEEDSPHLPRLSVPDRLLMCLDILHQGAWIAMGLVTDPATGEIEKNLEHAKVAIDAAHAVAEQLLPRLDDKSAMELQNALNTLRLTYLQQMN